MTVASVIDAPTRIAPARPGTLFVDVLRWPADADQRPHGRSFGRACLWLLNVGELPPEAEPTEDWVRLPVSEQALSSCIEQLADRVFHGRGVEPGTVRVIDGVLSYGGVRVTISDTEAAILNRLGESPDRLVTREELHRTAWSDHRGRGALDTRMRTLRQRVRPLGITIATVRGRGFVLTATPSPNTSPTTGLNEHRSTSWPSS